jgi:hypothetical protein
VFDIVTGNGVDCTTYFRTTVMANWDNGKALCERLGLTMATVRNQAENDLLSDNQPDSWLGGRRDMNVPYDINNQVFRWYTDDVLVCPFWSKPSEPNNFGGEEDCTQIYYSSKWNDLRCSRQLHIVCELRTCSPQCDSPQLGQSYQSFQTSVSSSSSSVTIQSGQIINVNVATSAPTVAPSVSAEPWMLPSTPTYIENLILNAIPELVSIKKTVGAHCTTYFETNQNDMTWEEASMFCESRGLQLASARDYYENQLLTQYYGDIWLSGRRLSDDVNDPFHETFSWFESGAPSYDLRCNNYWSDYEPNNYKNTESCIKLFFNGEWNDYDCDKRLNNSPVVCERRQCNPTNTECELP